MRSTLCVLAIALPLILAVPGTATAEAFRLRILLENTGAESHASGKLRFQLKEGQAHLLCKLRRLQAFTEYRLFASGFEKARFITNFRGEADPEFVSPYEGGDDPRALDFDPRDQEISIERGDGTVVLIADILDPAGAKRQSTGDIYLDAEAGVAGYAEGRFLMQPKGRGMLWIELDGAAANTAYVVVVSDTPGDAGVEHGVVETDPGGSGRKTFLVKQKNKPVRLRALGLAPFTDFLKLYTVDADREPDVLAYSGYVMNQLTNLCDPILVSFGPVPMSSGTVGASFETTASCERTLSIGLDMVSDRVHDVYIGLAGPIPVPVSSGSGNVTLSTEPEGDELPLTFDPRGEPMEVFDGPDQLFAGVFPSS